jgi:hypothetical protein
MADMERVYIGEREAMIAECAAWNPLDIGISKKECKYLVMPYGDGNWDTGWAANKSDAIAFAKEIATHYNVPICWV